ncbi:CRAL-TRIO domain-containing protein [Hyaloraphidium curvatum]|nr:CRAL-TRIO domain-containing protein [Hyaloraphidium curvatum]
MAQHPQLTSRADPTAHQPLLPIRVASSCSGPLIMPALLDIIDWTVGPPPQRPLAEQIRENAAVLDELRSKISGPPDDASLLALLRAANGDVPAASKAAEGLAQLTTKLDLGKLSLASVKRQLETDTLIYTGGRTASGLRNLYMRPARFRPGKDSLDELLRSLVYLLKAINEEEAAATDGISFTADLTDWGWSNFGVAYASQFFAIIQGKYPTRVRQFIMYNAPSWFGAVWKLIRPMMSEDFASRVSFVAKGEVASLYPDAKHLPKALGGELNEIEANRSFIKYRESVEASEGNLTV